MKTSYRHCATCNRLHDTAAWPHEVETAPAYDASAGYDEYLHGPRAGTFRRCKSCGELHDISSWPANHMEEPPQESDLDVCRNFISDTISFQGVKSMLDGKTYDSKSQLRRTYKAAGVTEMGNDKPAPFKKPKPNRKAIKEAVGKAIAAVDAGAKVENFVKQRKVTPIGGTFAGTPPA